MFEIWIYYNIRKDMPYKFSAENIRNEKDLQRQLEIIRQSSRRLIGKIRQTSDTVRKKVTQAVYDIDANQLAPDKFLEHLRNLGVEVVETKTVKIMVSETFEEERFELLASKIKRKLIQKG